ncbi:MAG: hypothetical protein HS130_01425 [Deltaproteobacteria bacterium]|nr:hypothetical protein [Deltaproteobacteria bacterium]
MRAYLRREVEERKLKEVLKVAMCAPTSWGRGPGVRVVSDPECEKGAS